MTAVGLEAAAARMRLVAPDGGWGWVVLAAALLVNVLIPGTLKSFGVLFVEFMRVFEASPSEASWMPALCYFLYSSLGPLSSILSTRYSYKSVTLVGGFLASCGLVVSYFANSVTYLYFSYGILFGTGAGLSFPVTIYIVSEYFDQRRGLATGLTISGSCIGTVLLPPFLQWMLHQFGYRTAVLIMGGLLLNTVAVAFLYHPVEQHMKLVVDVSSSSSHDNEPEKQEQQQHQQQANEKESTADVRRGSVVSMVGPVTLDPRRGSRISLSRRLLASGKQHQSTTDDCKDIATISGSVDERKNNNNVEEEANGCLSQLSILKDPLYLVILVSNAASAVSNTNFMILLPSYALALGHSLDSSALLLSVVSLFDLVGRTGGAALSDWNLVPKHYYFVGGLGLSGLALALLPMGQGYVYLAGFCALFGLASGLYIGTTAVVLADMLGPERLTSSYGISLFVNGICQLVGPPVCNLVYERVGSFQPVFMTLGCISVCGTALWAILPLIRRNSRRDASPV